MSSSENKAVVSRLMQEVWNEHKVEALAELLDADYVDLAYQPANAAGLQGTLAVLQTAFPDHQTVVEAMVAEGDKVMVRGLFQATHTGNFRGMVATGRTISIKVARDFRVWDGKIIEHWGLLDMAALKEQLS